MHILSCSLDSVDDWIMEQKVSVWDGQDCGICFCPIGKGDVGRLMRCGCWLHFECLGHGLRATPANPKREIERERERERETGERQRERERDTERERERGAFRQHAN